MVYLNFPTSGNVTVCTAVQYMPKAALNKMGKLAEDSV